MRFKVNPASTRLAFFLIALLVLLILVSAIVPQRGIAENQMLDWRAKLGENYRLIERFGLDRIYYTPTFFVVLGLLAVNLLAGNVSRFRTVYRVEGSLLRLRHLGSILFHLSLLVIIGATVTNFLFKYEGVFTLTEGQTLFDQPGDYHREFQGPLYSERYDRFRITLNDLVVTGVPPLPGDPTATITVAPSQQPPITAEVTANHPLAWNDLEFHLEPGIGFSPELFLQDSLGEPVVRSFYRLARTLDSGQWVHGDFVLLPERDLKIEIGVLGADTALETTRFDLAVYGSDSLLGRHTITTAEEVEVSGYKLTVPRLRRWCYIAVVDNPYLGLIFTGFWTALGGLTLGLLGRIRRKASVQ